ncbi:MAG: FprA family A-type flavoprotein, partial [Candidatus Coproplasma sp.]
MIKKDIINVGVKDLDIDLFEGMYSVPDGVAYNSYVVKGEKIAVIDSVDAHFSGEWLENIERVLGGKTPDYLIVQHMEPDHSGSI